MPRVKKKTSEEVMSEFQKRMLSATGREKEDMPKARQKWSSEKYFALLGDLLEEMMTHGHIRKPKIGFTNQVTDLADQELSECRLDLIIHSFNSREFSDQEIVENWGLNKNKKVLTPKEAANVGKMSQELAGLFDEAAE